MLLVIQYSNEPDWWDSLSTSAVVHFVRWRRAPGENVPAIRAAGNLLVIELEVSFLQIF